MPVRSNRLNIRSKNRHRLFRRTGPLVPSGDCTVPPKIRPAGAPRRRRQAPRHAPWVRRYFARARSAAPAPARRVLGPYHRRRRTTAAIPASQSLRKTGPELCCGESRTSTLFSYPNPYAGRGSRANLSSIVSRSRDTGAQTSGMCSSSGRIFSGCKTGPRRKRKKRRNPLLHLTHPTKRLNRYCDTCLRVRVLGGRHGQKKNSENR